VFSNKVRISWVHPDEAARAREALRRGVGSWAEVDLEHLAAPPAGIEVSADAWPRLAAHVARGERVREVISQEGMAEATRRFAASAHAVERAVLVEAAPVDDVDSVAGVLACEIDEFMAYGHFLSRLVELGAAPDPAGTVAAYERFVGAASRVVSEQSSWPERMRVARDGLAALYVRVGRAEQAEALYRERYEEEPGDTTVAIGAARAFLEAGDTARAVAWLDRAAGRADALGRGELAARLRSKAESLRARLN